MAFSLDNEPLTIVCPKCGEKINQMIRWFKLDDRSCPGCGAPLDTKELRREVDNVEAETEKMLRDIRKTIEIKLKV